MPITVVDTLIPHRPPMRLLDAVLAHDDARLWAHAYAGPQSAFSGKHGVRACVGLEYLAQAAAAFFSLRTHVGEAPKQGMLIACRSFTTELAHYPLDSSLLIGVHPTSPLPAAERATALVKFHGEIHLLQSSSELPDSVAACERAGGASAATVADFSVYL